VNVLSHVYGATVSWRRRWYARDPARARRLGRPVVSVGNLRVGGSGKTPVVAHLARLLVARGERPAILTRGYGRTRPQAGVTVVSDGVRVRADIASAGDEPLMLARALPGVPVLVGADRFQSGEHAEREYGVTVHLLDDGFQHLRLWRTVDLLLADETDLGDRVLPAGRLREPLANAAVADAVLVTTADPSAVDRVGTALGVRPRFQAVRRVQLPVTLARQPMDLARGARVLALSGIARPERFHADLAAAGWTVADVVVFRDHHPFSAADLVRVAAAARACGATAVLTTEKDAIRLEAVDTSSTTICYLPLISTIEPAAAFADWFFDRLAIAS
jgi:tetraacyldisaccharide 4'-kinase